MRAESLVAVLLLVSSVGQAHGYETRTHENLNRSAAESSIAESYLIGQLRFSQGLDEIFRGLSVADIIAKGGETEDASFRYLRHFHNPLALEWEEAGLQVGTTPLRYMSSLLWAQEPLTEQEFGNWSWHDARKYYYDALTATDAEDREDSFAKTFRALGQVIHLIEDTSVPAHARNDAHPVKHVYFNFETWALDGNNQDFIASRLNDPPMRPIVDLFEPVPGFVPITRLWDTDQYTLGTEPRADLGIGLAEYTNANFVSKDTIFTELLPTDHRHHFPFPNAAQTERWMDIYTITDEQNNDYRIARDYLRKLGPGEIVPHLVAISWFGDPLLTHFPQHQDDLLVVLDDQCYRDQASLLVPRAVGYSAAALNYFFRGILYVPFESVEMEPDGNRVSMKILNKTPNQEIGGGSVVVMASFLPADSSDTRRVGSRPLPVNAAHLRRDEIDAPVLSFTFDTSIPSDARNLQLMVVYRGALGGEMDAVIGHVVRPISEPFAFIIQDRLSLNGTTNEYPLSSDSHYTFCNPDTGHCFEQRDARSGMILWQDTTQQALEGRFKAYGAIETIAVAVETDCPTCFSEGELKLHINDRLMNEDGWFADEQEEAPATWRIEGVPVYYRRYPLIPALTSVVMRVTMHDGSVSLARLTTFSSARQLADKSLAWGFLGGGVSRRSIASFGLSGPSFTFEDSPSAATFWVHSLGGLAPTVVDETATDSEGVTHHRRLFVHGGDTSSYSDSNSVSCGYPICADSLEALEHLYSIFDPEMPSLLIEGVFERTYSDNELVFLLDRGIPPEFYQIHVTE